MLQTSNREICFNEMQRTASVKVYHGYGHEHNLVVYGHVFKRKAKSEQRFSTRLLTNLLHLIRLFMVKPYPFAKVRLHFYDQVLHQKAEYDGFFKFEWEADKSVAAGWHRVTVDALDDEGGTIASAEGFIYVPHITQYIFISDIDDTVMISHSSTWLKRLKELVVANPRTRRTFLSTQLHYSLLANAHTEKEQPNPFFYVSSSEWNLYDYLVETFRHHQLPEGVFLLNQLKRWDNIWKTGKTGHQGKLLRIARIMEAFPNQRFVLFGDNSQQDPEIYMTLSEKYGANMEVVYIRNVRPDKAGLTQQSLDRLETRGIRTCLFAHSDEAIAHSKKIQLIVS